MGQQIFQGFSKLIGTPYKDKDCWHIAKDFYKIEFGIDLKQYYEETPDNRDLQANMIYSNKGEFDKVDSPTYGDIILIKMYGVECHIAIYLDRGKILHTSKKTGCIIDSLSKWEKMVSGYYRVKNDKT